MSPKKYLQNIFAGVAVEKTDGGEYRCRINGLYKFNVVSGSVWGADVPADLMDQDFAAEGSVVTITPLEGIGVSEEAAADALLVKMIVEENIFLHEPKADDHFKPDAGARYITIVEEDAFHKHGDSLALDFRGVVLTDDDQIALDENYGDYHAHIVPEADFWQYIRVLP